VTGSQGQCSPKNARVRIGRSRLMCEMWPEMVRPAGFEPAAFGSGDLRTIQVSYFAFVPPSA
jgi:hypothetical protein